MKYAVKTTAGAVIYEYTLSFMTIVSIIQNLIEGGVHRHDERHIGLILFMSKICSYSKITAYNQKVIIIFEIAVNNYHSLWMLHSYTNKCWFLDKVAPTLPHVSMCASVRFFKLT